MGYILSGIWIIITVLTFKKNLHGFEQVREGNYSEAPLLSSSNLNNKKIFEVLELEDRYLNGGGCAVILSPKCPPCHQILEDITENKNLYTNISLFITNTAAEDINVLKRKYDSKTPFKVINKSKVDELGIKFTPAFLTYDKDGTVTKIDVSYN